VESIRSDKEEMMDIGKVISRAWQILWRWKILWVLGLLAALGGGTGLQANYRFGINDMPGWVTNLQSYGPGYRLQDLGWAPWIIALVLLLLGLAVLLGLALWVVSIMANGGLIAGVQQVEEEGSTSFRRAWRVGVQRFWTLLGIRLLFAITIFVLVGLLVGFILIVALVGGVTIQNGGLAEVLPRVVLPLICCGAPLCCGVFLLGIALWVLRIYAERAAVMEKMGAVSAIARGWQMLRHNLGSTLLIMLIVAGITVAIGWVVGLLGAAIVVPVGLAIFQHTPTAGEIVGGVLGLLVVWAIALFVNTLVTTFTSAIWTLLYRGFTAPKPQPVEAVAAPAVVEPSPAGPTELGPPQG
jgi:hypothetical protein